MYLVAGGDLVAVFGDADSAVMQHRVMVGANLDVISRRVTAGQWVSIRAELRATAPDLVIVDVRPGVRR
ncbi:hypothetical protein [Krasilnikovia sp. MM14-A1259]|uniref:hypothetical protein n=1 Tax=Krasilnikovia sp. MM14-A1259 TaxID=3373539 RepID=UPI0038135657